MSSILWLALKDLRLLWRDRVGLFWVLALPLLMALFFGSILGTGDSGKAKMTIAAVDESGSPVAEAFFVKLESSRALTCGGCHAILLRCSWPKAGWSRMSL